MKGVSSTQNNQTLKLQPFPGSRMQNSTSYSSRIRKQQIEVTLTVVSVDRTVSKFVVYFCYDEVAKTIFKTSGTVMIYKLQY